MRDTVIKSVFDAFVGTALSVFSRYPIGTNIFEFDWDVLVILDTCRVDALQEVAPEYEFLGEIESITSVGSTSSEWIACAFVDEYRHILSETAYVSANAFDENVLTQQQMPDHDRNPSWTNWSTITDEDLLELDQVWKYAPEPDHGHVRPIHITDRAIANHREYKASRMIVHYSQPHEPYTALADQENRDKLYEHEVNPWEYLKNGGDFELVWNAYIENLRMGLDSVAVLLENINADTVAISSDHGEAFGGKWGVNRHPIAVPHPKIKQVPWTTTTATDTGQREPSLEPGTTDRDVMEQLSSLGYK